VNLRRLGVLFLLLGAAVGFGARLDDMALRDSLRYLPPNIRSYYLDKTGFDLWPAAQPRPESTGLRLIGKWGAGPSVRVTGRDSIVYLSRGSEVVVLNYADTTNPRVLTTIQAPGLVARSILVGNRLYISSGYIETFDISDPANPVKLGSLFARAPAIDVVDTLVYTLYRDSFKVFNFADPANPQMLGACRDSGYDLSVCSGYAYVGDGGGLYVLDVTDPAAPHRVANWGNDVIGVRARTTICCATTGNPNNPGELRFTILDVRNPASPTRLGSLDSCGGYDVFLDDSLVFLSGYYAGGHEFQIVGIGDTLNPTRIGSCNTPGENFGVWANRLMKRAYVADTYLGLEVIGIGDLSSPVVDTNFLAAGSAEDVTVDGHLAYVEGVSLGMTILDVSSPSSPVELGHVDSTRGMIAQTVAARDSFAYMCWQTHPWLKVVDVSNPANPVKAASCDLFNPPVDMALGNSFLYVAEDSKFEIVEVARPRQPAVIGSCGLSGNANGLFLLDTLALVAKGTIVLLNVAAPTAPVTLSQIPHGAYGVVARDTFVYVPFAYDTLFVYSVADPLQPRVLGYAPAGVWPWDVALGDSAAFVSTSTGVDVFELPNPAQPVKTGSIATPYHAGRLSYAAGLVYVTMWDAGVAIYETVSAGVAERGAPHLVVARRVALGPNPATTRLHIQHSVGSAMGNVRLRDATGRVLAWSSAPSGTMPLSSMSLAWLAACTSSAWNWMVGQ
jgi:hypothetical protein